MGLTIIQVTFKLCSIIPSNNKPVFIVVVEVLNRIVILVLFYLRLSCVVLIIFVISIILLVVAFILNVISIV